MQFFICQHFWDVTKQHQGGAQSQPSEKLHCSQQLKDSSRFLKENNADVAELSHEWFKLWPSSALQCQDEPGADLSARGI